MAYTLNPYLPKLRAKAVQMVESGSSVRAVARYFGVTAGAISKWLKKSATMTEKTEIPTFSSRPHSHPAALSENIVNRIIELRKKTKGRCAEVIHQHLIDENISVSLSSVKRTLDRNFLTNKRNPLKRYHLSVERPLILAPGDLVQVDTIHLMLNEKQRFYVYTLIDLYSRWAHAWATDKANCQKSLRFVKNAMRKFPYQFKCLQSDHGSEFSVNFSERINLLHRHSRVRRPNDNAHLERFNRTLQQEFIDSLPPNIEIINRRLPNYLKHYNHHRLHLGINLKTPAHILNCFQAID